MDSCPKVDVFPIIFRVSLSQALDHFMREYSLHNTFEEQHMKQRLQQHMHTLVVHGHQIAGHNWADTLHCCAQNGANVASALSTPPPHLFPD